MNTKAAPQADARSLEQAHLDIGLGNDYRIEYIKHLLCEDECGQADYSKRIPSSEILLLQRNESH